ncbi:MAG: hypothetical protein ACE5H4_14790 [Candidatus Thorarchaeota archaeon]
MNDLAWGLFPLATDENECIMMLLSVFVLAVLVISIFMVFPFEVALFVDAVIVLGFVISFFEAKKRGQKVKPE